MVLYPRKAAGNTIDRMDHPLRERARRIDLFVRDFRTAQEDHRIAPSALGSDRHGTLAPQPTAQSSQVQVAVSSEPKDQETVVSASLAVASASAIPPQPTVTSAKQDDGLHVTSQLASA
jgi:hypothetical protein